MDIDMIRDWIGVLLQPSITAVGLYFIYGQLRIAAKNYDLSIRQAEEQQIWKKAEFIADQAKDFFSDEIVDRVISMLDWEVRKFPVPNLDERIILFLHDKSSENLYSKYYKEYFDSKNYVILADALRAHDETGDFTEIEMFVRDEFDRFFFRLGQFQQMIESKIFSYKEIEIHLNYILDLVSGGKENVAVDLQKAIDVYVKKYDFYAASAIIEKRKEKRKEKIEESRNRERNTQQSIN